MSTKTARNVRKLERPRPLKISGDSGMKSPSPSSESPGFGKTPIEDLIHDLEALHINLSNGNFDVLTTTLIFSVCNQLKIRGPSLEANYKDQLDCYFSTFRNASREDRIDVMSRLRLLEIIELRAMKWNNNESMISYYKRRISEVEASEQISNPIPLGNFSQPLATSMSVPNVPQATVSLAAGEVLKSSGKFAKPTKIVGKNYFKDEIIIRNSDSGKVMGIKGRRVHMIEELSDTIISFQRVNPGARDRLVQITGPNDDSISRAKSLIEDTIRRNASPIREKLSSESEDSSLSTNIADESGGNQYGKKQLIHSYSMSDATLGEYTFTVRVGRDILKVSGSKPDLTKTAHLVLKEFFAGQAEIMEKQKQVMASSGDYHSVYNKPTNFGLDSNAECFIDSFRPTEQTQFQFENSIKGAPWLCNGNSSGNIDVDRDSSPSSSKSSEEEETYKLDIDSPNEEELLRIEAEVLGTAPLETVRCFHFENKVESPSVIKAANNFDFLNSTKNASSQPISLSENSSVTVVRQPLIPSSPREEFEKAESVATLSALSAKARRSHFARTISSVEQDTFEIKDTVSDGTLPVLPCSRITYSREHLLDLANSPLSHATPKEGLRIYKEFPSIVKEVSSIFDPSTFRSQESSSNAEMRPLNDEGRRGSTYKSSW